MERVSGVYFIANDDVVDQAIAFLKSFRRFNPTLPLCLIPFAANDSQVAALHREYSFSVWRDHELLDRCDWLSRLFHGRTLGHYRKFVTWSGPFERFIYIDCDTVVLRSLNVVFGLLDRFDVVSAFSDDPGSRHWVWRDSIDRTRALTAEQAGFAANTGFFGSRRGFLPLDRVIDRAPAALALAEHMELTCYEQPVLNFMIVTSGGRYTSLRVLAGGSPDIPVELWAGELDMVVRDGLVVSPAFPAPVMMHWAGQWDRVRAGDLLPYRELWEFYRYL